MTEEEWLTCEDPASMLNPFEATASNRRKRLLALACCQRLSEFLQVKELQHALAVLDRWIEGASDSEERKQARKAALAVVPEQFPASAAWAVQQLLQRGKFSALAVLWRLHYAREDEASARAYRANLSDAAIQQARAEALWAERREQCHLVREVFGNPFRPVTFSPSWRTDTAMSLAKQMYESREFSAMPILADALQDAGCDSDELLNHLRDTTAAHVRGCWALDLVLGKE
jgi:hypothetical protein